jgi:hypothetical protein
MPSNDNSTNFNYLNNQFTSFTPRHLNDSSRGPMVELNSADKDIDQHDSKWQYTGNRDDFYSVSTHDQAYTQEEKALVRKIDLFIMPIICALDFLQVNKKKQKR